jgi:hypothetical protein
MLTIQEARISHPSAIRQIPRGATFECSRENILRALENRDRTAEQACARFLIRQIDRAVCAVVAIFRNFAGFSQPTVAADQYGSD